MQSFYLNQETSPPERVLCIGAHCDDIEIGCGGLLIQLCRAYPDIAFDWFIAVAPDVRATETRRAAEQILSGAGTYELHLHDFPDGFLSYSGAEVKRSLQAQARRAPPDLVLTHFREDAHQDHQFLSDITWQVFRDHFILEYEIPKYDGDLARPNWFVPLDREIIDRKIQCLTDCFASQRNKPWFDAETFRGLMRLRGIECRAPSGFAEGYHLRKGVWQVT